MSPFWILLELRMMEVLSGDNWSYETCKAPVKSSPTNQRPTCYRPDALPVAQPTVSEHWREFFSRDNPQRKEKKTLLFLSVSQECRSTKGLNMKSPVHHTGRHVPPFTCQHLGLPHELAHCIIPGWFSYLMLRCSHWWGVYECMLHCPPLEWTRRLRLYADLIE